VTYRSPNDIGYHAFSSPPATPAGSCAEPAAAPVAAPVVAAAAPRSALSSGRALTLLELSALSVDDDLDDY
jgi:3-oxoacyl-ACP reductase-like protein